ncbi:MAG: TRAM domain-containing protein, partial [Actinomycetaceae bacterium]|nr:TRAM domain-containing protein [Actinomycetaceae bacterium]
MAGVSLTRYVDVCVGDIAHGGFCVGRGDDGRVVFARFALPGELVRVAVTKEKKKLVYGDAVEVLEGASPYRVPHAWEEAGPLGVGGADLGHVAFSWQTEWKRQVIEGALRRIGGEDLVAHLAQQGVAPRVFACGGDEETQGWHTRTRIELVADSQGNLGMTRPFSHDVVPLTSMPLAVPEIDELELFSGAWSAQLREGTRVKAVAASGSDVCAVIGNQVFSAPRMPTEPFVREDVVVDGQLYSYRVRASGFWQIHRA